MLTIPMTINMDEPISMSMSTSITQWNALSDEAKEALLNCFAHVAWIDDQGQTYYDALEQALYDNTWSITNTLTGCTNTNPAETVYKDSSYSAIISPNTGYVLEGATVSITMGGVDVTASVYNNGTISIAQVTGDLVITVVAVAVAISSISAVYTQSGTVYDTDSLDSLKAHLVVTATYSDSSTAVIPSTDYTLSGTLTVGTSTITVSYGGKTTTFTVIVSAPYEVIDYISSNNLGGTPSTGRLQYAPYIKTAFPAADTDIISYTVRLTFVKEFNWSACPFGGRNAKTAGATTRGTVLTLEDNTKQSSLVYGNNGGSALVTYIGAANFFQVGTKYTLEIKNGGVYVDDVLISSIGATSAIQLATYNWGLFARNNQGSWATATSGGGDLAPMIGKIYEFSIKDGNGNYVLNYVPRKRIADSVYGMLDLVDNTFYTSQGVNPFIGGND